MGRSKPKKKSIKERQFKKAEIAPVFSVKAPDAELLRKLGAFIDTGASVTACDAVEKELNKP